MTDAFFGMTNAFFDTIKKGDLVVASAVNLKKYHLLSLRSCAKDTDGRRDKVDRSRLWNGTALCLTEPTKATFGNRTTYYWEPHDLSPQQAGENLCAECRRRWQRDGLTVTYSGASGETPAYPLPFGWRKVDVGTHPHDVPPGVDPVTVVDKTGKVVGKPRTEVHRWQRGPRIVRITHYYGDDTFEVSTHDIHRVAEVQHSIGPAGLARIWRVAHTMMAAGCAPTGRLH